jgi:hypothetical protein
VLVAPGAAPYDFFVRLPFTLPAARPPPEGYPASVKRTPRSQMMRTTHPSALATPWALAGRFTMNIPAG